MPEMKTLNGYEVVDAKAREDIKELQNAGHATEEYVDNAIAAIPKPDYTGLATEAYVDNAIANIPEVDLSNHALKSELPTKVSQLQNDSKYITREEVPETDLSEYAKKSEIPDVSNFITDIPSEYITEDELNAKGYLTQHQDISGKADKNHEHTNYATQKDLEDVWDTTEEYLNQHYYKGSYIEGNFAVKSSVPTKVSQLTNDKNYISSIPSEYVTESELDAKINPIEASIAALEADCPETYFLDFSDATTTDKAATEHMLKFVNKFMHGANTEAVVMMKTPSSKYYYPAIVSTYADGLLMTPMALNPNTIDNTPLSWEGIYLYTNNDASSGSYRTYGSNTKTLVSKEYVDIEISNIEIPEVPSLDGYATEEHVEEYVNTTVNNAISGVACATEVLDVTALTETSQALNALYSPGAADILNRIASGEKFPFCLNVHSQLYKYPESLSYDASNVVIDTPIEILNKTGGYHAVTMRYKFERENNTWYGYTEERSTLVRVLNTEV